MANPNPKTEQLALGRGKRPKLNHETVSMRMSSLTRENLEEIAYSYDCTYGGRPWIAGLLEKIASGELTIVPTPPPRKVSTPQPPLNVRQDRRKRLADKLRSSASKPSKHTPPENPEK